MNLINLSKNDPIVSRHFHRGIARAYCALAAFLVALAPSPVRAWNGSGHMVIAAMAYDEMKPEPRGRVDALLRTHEDYTKWKKSFPADAGITLEKFVFIKASVWADEIRRKGHPADHPNWHFINYPLIQAEGFPEKPSPSPKDDAL